MPLAEKFDTIYTYKDYLTWPDDERWEIIDGIPYNMSPAPSRRHQSISIALSSQFYNFFKNKTCKVYSAPFDVRFPLEGEKDEEITRVVQPDIIIVCDNKKLDDKGCRGAPDLIVEILSPHTAAKDVKEKFFLYEMFQILEYWIIHPLENILEVYKLGENKKYLRAEKYTLEDKVEVALFEGLIIDLSLVFAE